MTCGLQTTVRVWDALMLEGRKVLLVGNVDIQQGTLTGAVVFVTFASGPVVYGLQGVSTNAATLPEDEIVGAARDLYERVTAAP